MIPTQITTTVDQDSPFNKVITAEYGEFSFNQWLATLSTEDQQEWEKQCRLHNTAVDAAVAAGDARVTLNIKNNTIEWRTEEIHSRWMNTISVEDHASYHSFWTRYHTATTERKE
jgi:hypothetical protein